MAKKRRLKTVAAAVPVAQDLKGVDDQVTRIGEIQREMLRINSYVDDRVAKIKAAAAENLETLKAEEETLQEAVQLYCDANRAKLTRDGKRKTVKFSNGLVQWRKSPRKVVLRKVADVLTDLREAGLTKFIRTKEEVNKDAILADSASVSGIAGITIQPGKEEFIIIPDEAELPADA